MCLQRTSALGWLCWKQPKFEIIRQFLDVAKTVEENHIPNITYHRKCRSLFTMKRDLESIKRKREESVDEDANPTKRQCRRTSILPLTEGEYIILYAFSVIRLNS